MAWAPVFHAALGIDEEGAGDHNPLAGNQAFGHLDLVADPPPVSTSRGSTVPVAVIDEHGPCAALSPQ